MDYKNEEGDEIALPGVTNSNQKDDGVDLRNTPHFGIDMNPLFFFEALRNQLTTWSDDEITRALINFKVSLIQNRSQLPEELFESGVAQLLVDIKPPRFSFISFRESVLCSCVWTALQDKDLAPYFDDDYFDLLYQTCIETSAQYENLDMFAATLCLIKNITSESGDKSLQLSKMHGLESLALLYNETQSKEIQNTITQIVLNILNINDIPLEFGHFAADMYLPTLRSNLENMTSKDIEVLHLFCLSGLNYAKYFMDFIGPNKLFQVYKTADVEVRIAILKFWKEMTECPDKNIAYSANFLPWDTLIEAIDLDNDATEMQCVSDLLLNAFKYGEDVEQAIFETNIIYKYLSCIEGGQYDLRPVALKTLAFLVESNTKSVISYIVENEYIKDIISMLEVCDNMTLEFALRLLLKLISQNHPNNEYISIVKQLEDYDFEDIENDLFDDEELDLGAMFEVFLDHVPEFIQNCPLPEDEGHIEPIPKEETSSESTSEDDDIIDPIPHEENEYQNPPSQPEDFDDDGFEDVD